MSNHMFSSAIFCPILDYQSEGTGINQSEWGLDGFLPHFRTCFWHQAGLQYIWFIQIPNKEKLHPWSSEKC